MALPSQISVHVHAPAGLPPIKAILSCDPNTQAEFDAIVEALGGPCVFRYHSDSTAHADLGDNAVFILSAPDRWHSYDRPMCPAIRDLKDACNGG